MAGVKSAFITALALLLAATCAAAAGFSSFKVLAPSSAVLETIEPNDGEMKRVDLQSSRRLEVRRILSRRWGRGRRPSPVARRPSIAVAVPSTWPLNNPDTRCATQMTFDIDGSVNQARAIVQRGAADNKNVVLALTPSGGKSSATFGWDAWKNRFGEIEQGAEFDVSIAIWSKDPALAHRVDVAKLTYTKGPSAAPSPGNVALATRITEALASMSLKPEISHMFRPEEKMIPAPVSCLCALAVLAPLVGALVLMAKGGEKVRAKPSSKTMASLFYGGLVVIVAIEVAFWLGVFNLIEVFPLLVVAELAVMASGIRMARTKAHAA